MMHVGIFPTWACQLACDYCSIRNSKVDRGVPGVPWQKWAEALPKALSYGSIVDIAGGEPLLYPGLVDLLHALGKRGIRWAITTNGKAQSVVRRICDERPHGGVVINISDHAGNPEAHASATMLRQAGYLVVAHRVGVEGAGEHEPDATTITYQDWKGGAAVDGVRRVCTAGIDHWVADPQGYLWRCVVAMETGQPSNGNLFTRAVRPIREECDFGCSTAYTEDPASWCVQMRSI